MQPWCRLFPSDPQMKCATGTKNTWRTSKTRKTPPANVKAIVPTADELEKARAKREAMSGKQKRALKGSVRHFFSINKVENEQLENGIVDDATLDKWLTWLNRCDDSSKVASSERTFKKGVVKYADLEWWTIETGPPKFGPNRWAYWQESNMLPERGDRISGSKEKNPDRVCLP